jgi:hypothetical protein
MQLMSNVFNNIQSEWFNSCANVKNQDMQKNSLIHSSINVKH